MENRKAEKLVMTAIGIWWLQSIVVPLKALHLRRAAQRDERRGFRYTAAIEWRHAAELFAPSTMACEYCWRQWERIMLLPRRLAEPVGVPVTKVIPLKPALVTRPVRYQIPIAA